MAVFTASGLSVPATASEEAEPAAGGAWTFSEQSASVGLAYTHAYDNSGEFVNTHWIQAGGLGIGDVNNDGWDDIFAVTGFSDSMGANTNPNKLFLADGDGTFTESAAAWGLNDSDRHSSGPLIVDVDGDGWNDLLLGGVDGTRIRLYKNTGASSFSDATAASALGVLLSGSINYGFAAADINRDGDLDLFVAHWVDKNKPLLLENNGAGIFSDITATHLTGVRPLNIFTPTFADINGDSWADLMLTDDFLNDNSGNGGSKYFLNNGSGVLVQQGLPVPLAPGPEFDPFLGPDENGMGGALADYDNDGDLDWFASSIFDTDGVSEGIWGISGNRLYENNGTGQFTDVTETALLRDGSWGWGSCFADFDNDADLDLYHVNGYPASGPSGGAETDFDNDPARMFINNGDGTFTEQAVALGVADTGQGRAILCFDNDHDGDIDILVNNNHGNSRFFRNDLANGKNWIVIRLQQDSPNHEAIGAKISLTAGGLTQVRQVLAGGNFESSHPTAQHFGLDANTLISNITVTWPDGGQNTWTDVATKQYIVLIKESDLVMRDGFE